MNRCIFVFRDIEKEKRKNKFPKSWTLCRFVLCVYIASIAWCSPCCRCHGCLFIILLSFTLIRFHTLNNRRFPLYLICMRTPEIKTKTNTSQIRVAFVCISCILNEFETALLFVPSSSSLSHQFVFFSILLELGCLNKNHFMAVIFFFIWLFSMTFLHEHKNRSIIFIFFSKFWCLFLSHIVVETLFNYHNHCFDLRISFRLV